MYACYNPILNVNGFRPETATGKILELLTDFIGSSTSP